MKCPNDTAKLLMSERNGVEIDYCPECRGVWLDRGELDKLIEKADANLDERYERRGRSGNSGFEEDEYTDEQRQGGRRRRGGFLGDFFEFGD